jgi:hypothetical protein
LTTERARPSSKKIPKLIFFATSTLLASTVPFVSAQAQPAPATQKTQATQTSQTDAMLSLPDAPSFATSSSASTETSTTDAINNPSDAAAASRRRLRYATRRDITIQPGEIAPTLAPHDKVVLGLEESFTLFSVIGWTTSAGYSQLVNGSPNYGTDSGAFGMRLGATAIRNISENVFGDAIFAPLFHEDPRYFKMGSGHNVFKRGIYAATRAIITRTDDGHETVNYSLLAGNATGAALTNAYYPRLNQGASQTAKTFGTSVGGSAIGLVVTEFLDDALKFAHLQKLE